MIFNTDKKSGRIALGILALLSANGLLACASDAGGDELASATAARTNYAALVHATYADTLTGAQALQAAVTTLTMSPSQASLDAARLAWRTARETYLQTEAFRFYDGPIDNPSSGPEGFINAWPLDENYIDYVVGNPMAGIVNDPARALDAAQLQSLNEAGGEANIATGYHAIEFLLWGQDLNPAGPGMRPFTDYVDNGMGNNAARRALYLNTVTSLLVTQIAALVQAWAPGIAGNYRSQFEAADSKETLRRMMTGLIVLSGFETGGERIQPALDNADQEDEHSCFSDNTHRDFVQDVRGIQNVFLGKYVRTDNTMVGGPGIVDVIAAVDASLATNLTAQMAQSLALAQAIVPPFDQEILLTNTAGRMRVSALLTSLQAQEALLEKAFLAFGLTIPAPE